ncbi:glycosyltransferase family 39 protein [Trichothermofontia sp.]
MTKGGQQTQGGRVLLAIAIGMIVLGTVLRFANLDSKVFWVDEVFTALRISGYTEADLSQFWQQHPFFIAQDLQQFQTPGSEKTVLDTIRSLAVQEPNHSPLYFVLARFWMQIFGSSTWVLRSFSVVTSILSLPLMYGLARELYPDRRMGVMALALLAVSPLHVLYAQEARPYSLWVGMTLLASWTLLRALRQRQPQAWVAFSLATLLALYTYPFALFIAVGQALYVGLLRAQSQGAWRSCLLALAVALVGFSPWLVALIRNGQRGAQLAAWQTQNPAHGIPELSLHWGLHLTRPLLDFENNYTVSVTQPFPYLLVVLAAVALVAYAFYDLWAMTPRQIWLFPVCFMLPLAAGVILPDLILGGQRSVATRYFLAGTLGVPLVIAHLLVRHAQGTAASRSQRQVWTGAIVGLLLLGTLASASNVLASTSWTKQGGYIPYAAQIINQTENPLVSSERDLWLLSFAHALRPETVIQVFNSQVSPPLLPLGFSDYFIYAAPPAFMQQFQQASGLTFVPLPGLESVPLWQLQRPEP